MAEWSIAAVLKTVEGNTSGGSNPSLSAKIGLARSAGLFSFLRAELARARKKWNKTRWAKPIRVVFDTPLSRASP
jgi:hypothetical protein